VYASARGDDEMHKLQKIVIWVNECVAHEETFALPTTNVERLGIDIPASLVRAGANRITVQAYNRLELRDQASESIDYDRPKTQPTLHGLLIGVSDYTKTVPMMLKLSGSEDVAGVESLWRAQEGKQFRKASLIVLRNADATHDRILRAFETLRRDVKADDVLLLYLAGHGLASDQILNNPALAQNLQVIGRKDYKSQGVRTGMFFFAPADFDIRRPLETGVSDDDMYAAIRKLPCRKIILLDACRSGTLRNSDPIRKLAPSGVGPVIISACEPHQSAVEAPDPQAEIWVEGEAKGLFAISLLQGLSTKFNFQADADHDGVISASELVEYTRTEVPKLLNKLLFGKRDPMTEQFPSAFLPDLERRMPVARKAAEPPKQ
jgi:hypothetical protein